MERTLLYKHGRQAFAYQEFQERLGSAAKKLLPVVMGFVVMATTLGYTNNAWAQKGVNDITLAPGKTVALNFKVYCIKYGMPLTSEPVEFRGRSQQGVVHILHYARSKGYVDSNPVQVQLAIWRQTTGEWKAADHAIAEEIFKNAKKAPTESKAGAVFLTDAVKAGTVQVVAAERGLLAHGESGEAVHAAHDLVEPDLLLGVEHALVANAERIEDRALYLLPLPPCWPDWRLPSHPYAVASVAEAAVSADPERLPA